MNRHINQSRKIKLHFKVIGSGKELTTLIDGKTTLIDVLRILTEFELIPTDYYTQYSLQNKRTNSFLSNSNLYKSGITDGDLIWVFPPLGNNNS